MSNLLNIHLPKLKTTRERQKLKSADQEKLIDPFKNIRSSKSVDVLQRPISSVRFLSTKSLEDRTAINRSIQSEKTSHLPLIGHNGHSRHPGEIHDFGDHKIVCLRRALVTMIPILKVLNYLRAKLELQRNFGDKKSAVAGQVLVRTFKRRLGKVNMKKAKLVQITRRYGLLLVLKARISKKRFAAATLASFLTDLFSIKLPVMITQLRFQVVRLQRYIRGFCRITEARQKALALLWAKLEKEFNSTIIPDLLVQLEKKKQKALRRKLERNRQRSSKEVKTKETQHFPELIQGVNSANFLMTKLTDSIRKGQRLIDRCPPDKIHKDIFHANAPERIQRKKELIATFLYDLRTSYKRYCTDDLLRRASLNLTLDDAKRLIHSKSDKFDPELLLNRKRKRFSKYPFMRVFTGEKRGEFELIVENFIRGDHGIALRDAYM